MNNLGSTYIQDRLARYQIQLCAAWRLTCIERKVADDEAPAS